MTDTVSEIVAHARELGIDPTFAETVGAVAGPISLREADLLRDLASRVRRGVIVEIGSYQGRSTVALTYGTRQGHDRPVFAIDPHESFAGPFGGNFGPQSRRAFYQTMLTTGYWENVRLINLPSVWAAQGWQHPVGLLWIDGDHSYEGVRADYTYWEPHLLPGARLVLDDTNRGGPKQLLEELLDSGEWVRGRRAQKVRVLRRAPGRSGRDRR